MQGSAVTGSGSKGRITCFGCARGVLRRLHPRHLLTLALSTLISEAGDAAPCRQALAIGLDVSGSVDGQEYNLQLNGLAQALEDPDVRAALTASPRTRVELSVYEWSGPTDQRLLIPWQAITSQDDIQDIADKLRRTERLPAHPATAIGQAMLYGADLLHQRSDCWQQTLDLSADGMSNAGLRPRDVKPKTALGGLTINGLVITSDDAEMADIGQGPEQLVSYFTELIIQGPLSFVERADGYDAYAAAMARKLLRELSGLTISDRSRSD
ncbi:DUF1194 domain-containing protein [Aliiroseovarius crassostreae]|uniref:DUF1194 domain-containing protein n=1 Tax=Aliiroseovarius crassostreae TaxID=154981 RepID=UPI003C7A17EE